MKWIAIPRRINVVGHPYKVEVSKTERIEGEDHNTLGLAEHDRCVITIRANLPASQVRDSILHEVMHALSHHTQSNLTHRQIHALTPALIDTLRRNKDLALLLIGPDTHRGSPGGAVRHRGASVSPRRPSEQTAGGDVPEVRALP